MLIKQKRWRIIAIASFCVIVTATGSVFTWYSKHDKRSTPGRIVRWFDGEGEYDQRVNDLVQDIREKPELVQLRQWGMETIRRVRAGEAHVSKEPSELSDGAIKLAIDETPQFVRQLWGVTTNGWGGWEPEIGVVLSKNPQEERVSISWYMYGIVVGNPDYHMSVESNLCIEAKPGIYVYHGTK